MNRICEGLRELMLDYALDELDGLKAARLEAHLVNCPSCRSLHTRLKEGLSAAREFEPHIDPADLERMVAQVAPLFRESRDRPRWRWFALAAAGAAAAGMGLVLQPPDEPFLPRGRVVEVLPTPSVEPVVHKIFSSDLRAVASEDFDGTFERVEGGPDVLRMEKGFAVLDYTHVTTQPLWVYAPGVRVKVLGTRFFVEARPSVGTAIGVIAGRVEVETKDRQEYLPAGTVRSFGEDSARTPSAEELWSTPYHRDPFLDRRKKPAKTRSRHSSVAPVFSPPEIAEGLATAEDLARQGRAVEALAVYGRLLEHRGVTSEIRDLIRFERARARAIMGDQRAACTTYDALVEGARGEVRVQAALSQCGCRKAHDPCKGIQCLDRLTTGVVKGAEREATRLRRKWGRGVTCVTHNTREGVQQNQ